jgi:hypothetical protein
VKPEKIPQRIEDFVDRAYSIWPSWVRYEMKIELLQLERKMQARYIANTKPQRYCDED